MQALALLTLAGLALLGIVGEGDVGGLEPEPGSGSLLALGGITSGARSASLGSRTRASWAAGLTPIQSKTLPLSSRPSAQPESRSVEPTIAPAIHPPSLDFLSAMRSLRGKSAFHYKRL